MCVYFVRGSARRLCRLPPQLVQLHESRQQTERLGWHQKATCKPSPPGRASSAKMEPASGSPRLMCTDEACRICPQVPYFSSDCLIPKTGFSSDNLVIHAAREDRSMHHFPQFPTLQMPHYHDCANCRRSFACVCQTPREKIFCLQCWEETQQGEAREALRAR